MWWERARGSAVRTIVNLAEDSKLAREGVKAPSHSILSVCKSLVARGVAGGVWVQNPHTIQYNGPIQGLKYIWKTEGFQELFRGNGTKCARIVPNSAVKFFGYEQASRNLLITAYVIYQWNSVALLASIWQRSIFVLDDNRQDAQLSPALRLGAGACADIIAMSATYPMDMLACGSVAGTIGQTVAYPLDVVRRRMQMVGWKDAASVVTGKGKSKAPLEYTGMIDAFQKIVRHEGFGALYKGLVPNSVVPSIAIAFVTYEVVKDVPGLEMRIYA
ncbi:hypothetical protein ZIOFF_066916 [Zingiber officinale]|uniref:Uncharacterized protein n=1 Tax=Zingiber officinale TaxID=94328 RepID=A0A8J5CEP7_ZINOF|nr:hypothetical protein ZIOFF_066916 [Zingiber officinale]